MVRKIARIPCAAAVLPAIGLVLLYSATSAKEPTAVNYSPVHRTGTQVLNQWTESVKTAKGRQCFEHSNGVAFSDQTLRNSESGRTRADDGDFVSCG